MSQSILIAVHNHTPELLTVEGSQVLNGRWRSPEPAFGEVITRNAMQSWVADAEALPGTGPQALWLTVWLTISCTKGYLKIAFDFNGASVEAEGQRQSAQRDPGLVQEMQGQVLSQVWFPEVYDDLSDTFISGMETEMLYLSVFLNADCLGGDSLLLGDRSSADGVLRSDLPERPADLARAPRIGHSSLRMPRFKDASTIPYAAFRRSPRGTGADAKEPSQ